MGAGLMHAVRAIRLANRMDTHFEPCRSLGIGLVFLPLPLLLGDSRRLSKLLESRRRVVELVSAGVDLNPSSFAYNVHHHIVLLLRHFLYPAEEEESP